MTYYKEKEIISNIFKCNNMLSLENFEDLFENKDITPLSKIYTVSKMYNIPYDINNCNILYYLTYNLSFDKDIIKYCLDYVINNHNIHHKDYSHDMCPICLDELGSSYIKLSCSHSFHLECIKESQKVSKLCPYCRAENDSHSGETDIWNSLINIVYYGHDISLVEYILDKYPGMCDSNFRKNYYDIPDKEHINYSFKEVVIECSRIDILFLLYDKYNYIFLNNFIKFPSFSVKNFSKLYPNFKQKIIHILENSEYINSDFMIETEDIFTTLTKLNLPNLDNAICKFITNNFDMLVSYSYGGYFRYIIPYLLKFNNLKFEEFTTKLLRSIFDKYTYKPTEGTEDFLTILNDTINLKHINHNNLVSKLKIYLKIIENLLSDEELKNFIIRIKSKYIIHKLSVIKGGVVIIKIISKIAEKCNKQIILDQRDDSCFVPALDAARYGCFDTFKYLIQRTNLSNLYPGYVETCSSEYNYDISILFASLINSDKRIFNYLLNNYDKFKNHFTIIDDNKNIIGYLFGKKYCKIDFKERYKRIKKMLNLLSIKNNYIFTQFYFSLLINLGSDMAFKLYQDFPNTYMNDDIMLESIGIHGNCLNSHDIVSISEGNFNTSESWIINKFLFPNIINRFNMNLKIKILEILIIRTQYNHPNIDYMINKFNILSQLNFIHCIKNFNLGWENNNNDELITNFKNKLKLFIKDFSQVKSLNFPDLIKELSSKQNYYYDEHESFVSYKLGLLLLNGAPLNLNIKNLSIEGTKWLNCIKYLKQYVKKKYNKFTNFEQKIITDIAKTKKFSLSNFKIINPSHIKPIDYLRINNNYCLISEKADGVTKRGTNTIMKNITPVFPYECLLESEFVSELNIYFVFNVLTENINDYLDIYEQMRLEHPFLNKEEKIEEFTMENYKNYLEDEKKLLSKYVTELKKTNKSGWWPKKIWKFSRESSLNDISDIIELKNDNYFNTDGWIVTDLDDNNIYKIKPDYHMTVDLKWNYQSEWFADKKYPVFNVNHEFDFDYSWGPSFNTHIYRCYWENNKWVAKESRPEKERPNPIKLVEDITRYHKNKWTIRDITKIVNKVKPYYKNISFNEIDKKSTPQYIKIIKDYLENKVINILDIGCGHRDFINHHWTGIDIDLDVVEYNNSKNRKCIWMDFTEDLNIERQQELLGVNLFKYVNNMNTLQNKYSCILLLNCIHYAKTSQQKMYNLINNINNKSYSGTLLVIRYLDKNAFNHTIKKTDNNIIKTDKGFVKKLDQETIEIYYSWVHKQPQIEYLFDDDDLEIFYEYGWDFKHTLESNTHRNSINSYNDNNTLWENYFNCFKTIILQYK
jgi:hypothetical protein